MSKVHKAENKYGPLYLAVPVEAVNGHSEMLFEEGFWRTLETEDYDVFIDIGAAWGYHTRVAANYAKEVYSFEPHPIRYEILKRNVEEFNNVFITNDMVGTGEIKPYMNPSDRGMVGPKSGGRTQPIDVDWITLEDLLLDKLDKKGIIKIDVEGAELDVLESAGDLTKYKNYIWLIERHDRGDDNGITEEALFKAMSPFSIPAGRFVGELLETRKWTYLYVFRWRYG
jgi:FkbM family methyltransferase